jgi:hypothetical protein
MLKNLTNDIITSYQTPFKTVMTLSPEESIGLDPRIIPCIKLSSSTAVSFRKEFPRICGSARQFVIYWDEPYFDDALCELLVHSIFSTSYLFISGRPVLVFGTDIPVAAAEVILKKLEVVMASQGIHKLLPWQDVTIEQGSDRLSQPVFINHTTLLKNDWLQKNLFSDLRSMTGHVIMEFDNPVEAFEARELLDNACKSFLAKQPLISNSVNDYLSLQNRVAQLSAAHQQLNERFSGAEKTIDVIRTKYKDDYENLFKWYHNEYEILPLWYKRFGHILKVMMGKRSFRSLFSDDVKKYKN